MSKRIIWFGVVTVAWSLGAAWLASEFPWAREGYDRRPAWWLFAVLCILWGLVSEFVPKKKPPVPIPQNKSDLSKKATETPSRTVIKEEKNIENTELANLQTKDASAGYSQLLTKRQKLGVVFLGALLIVIVLALARKFDIPIISGGDSAISYERGKELTPIEVSSPYKNSEHRFSISFPKGWTIKKGTASETVVKAVHQDADGRLAMISIGAFQLKEAPDICKMNPRELFALGMSGNPGLDMVLLESGTVSINGKCAVWQKIDTRQPTLGSSLGRKYLLIHNNTLFTVGAATDRDPSYYARFEATLEESVHTLKFY